ncbi:HD domain-containing phosphohydrolase [Thiolapillus sp.]
MAERVLFVDDELNVLSAYKRALRRRYSFDTACSGREALEKLKGSDGYAVIVSDMRMPEMNGVELLSEFRKRSPDTVRIMLTGNSDQQTAVDAVNEGDIFRFLNKPCSPQELAAAIDGALDRYRARSAERQVLEQTVKGSLNALSEVLSLANPEAFGRAPGIRKYMLAVLAQLGRQKEWWHEPLAMLCQVGHVILPESILEKVAKGASLGSEERDVFGQYPEVGAELLSRIPRMEVVAESIRYQEKHFDGSGFPKDSRKGDQIPFGGRLLKVTLDFDRALGAGLNVEEAIARLRWNRKYYDPDILSALEAVIGMSDAAQMMEVDVHGLLDGMLLQQNISTRDGRLLVRKGQEVSPTLRKLVYNFWENDNIQVPILVSQPDKPVEKGMAG